MTRQLSPQEARRLNYPVIDVREFPEHAAASISGAALAPLSTVERVSAEWDKQRPLVLVCRSGKRAAQAAEKLERLGFQDVAVLEGGMDAWQRAGFPVDVSTRKPWSLERQVRTVAGSMVVLSSLLGMLVSPWFFAWTLFVGAGLTFSGVTDICFMATLLGKLPWNRAAASAPSQNSCCGTVNKGSQC